MKYAIVPQEDIDALEKATEDLFRFLESGSSGVGRFYPETFTNITGPMRKITHTRYPENKLTFITK